MPPEVETEAPVEDAAPEEPTQRPRVGSALREWMGRIEGKLDDVLEHGPEGETSDDDGDGGEVPEVEFIPEPDHLPNTPESNEPVPEDELQGDEATSPEGEGSANVEGEHVFQRHRKGHPSRGNRRNILNG